MSSYLVKKAGLKISGLADYYLNIQKSHPFYQFRYFA